jgi:hypothetical protein
MISVTQRKDKITVATLHSQTINQGFQPKPGSLFLESLYRFLIAKELVLFYKENDVVRGFVQCAPGEKYIPEKFA